jgi:hypothetical protein
MGVKTYQNRLLTRQLFFLSSHLWSIVGCAGSCRSHRTHYLKMPYPGIMLVYSYCDTSSIQYSEFLPRLYIYIYIYISYVPSSAPLLSTWKWLTSELMKRLVSNSLKKQKVTRKNTHSDFNSPSMNSKYVKIVKIFSPHHVINFQKLRHISSQKNMQCNERIFLENRIYRRDDPTEDELIIRTPGLFMLQWPGVHFAVVLSARDDGVIAWTSTPRVRMRYMFLVYLYMLQGGEWRDWQEWERFNEACRHYFAFLPFGIRAYIRGTAGSFIPAYQWDVVDPGIVTMILSH